MALSIQIRETTLVKFDGKLDGATSPGAERELQAVVDRAPAHVVLDLSGLTFLTSAGLRVLFLTRKGLTSRGSQCFLMNPQPQIAKVLEIAKALPDLRVFKNARELDDYLTAIQAKVIEGDD
jgi:anti-anti-sigma factor